MFKGNMDVPPSQDSKEEKPEEEIEGEELENKEGEIDAKESVEKRSLNPIKRLQELKARKEVLKKEREELQEERKEKAKEKISELSSEMENRIRKGENPINQRGELVGLGKKLELELAEYAKEKLEGLIEIADNVFPEKLKALKEEHDNFLVKVDVAGDYLSSKGSYKGKYDDVRRLFEKFRTTVEGLEIGIEDLDSLQKRKK